MINESVGILLGVVVSVGMLAAIFYEILQQLLKQWKTLGFTIPRTQEEKQRFKEYRSSNSDSTTKVTLKILLGSGLAALMYSLIKVLEINSFGLPFVIIFFPGLLIGAIILWLVRVLKDKQYRYRNVNTVT